MGQHKASLSTQLNNFSHAFSSKYLGNYKLAQPTSWNQAFSFLTEKIKQTPKNKKCILFFDELPWLANKKSGFLQALDYYWNTQWSQHPNVILIVSGSAASWMLDKLIHAKGGLHNRLTHTINLKPFSLQETCQYLKANSFNYNNAHALQLYMIIGGVPYYLDALNQKHSVTQNINEICFKENGLLYNEFTHLFAALFDQHTLNEAIVRAIATKRYGISRDELLAKLKLTSGGSFNKRLQELEAAGFIQSFTPFGYSKKYQWFRISDEYVYFYLDWIEPQKNKSLSPGSQGYWHQQTNTPRWHSWAGYAFEAFCTKHLLAIKNALGLQHVMINASQWRKIKKNGKNGAQIDLLLDRNDDTITLCEIKYTHKKPYTLTRADAKNIAHKLDCFERAHKTNSRLELCLITNSDLTKNSWSEGLIDKTINLEDILANG